MEEVFRDIKGYEGLYQISNLGKVRSLNYRRTNTTQILRQGKQKAGYLFVLLCNSKGHKTNRIHRLVADAFIPNTNNYPCVNHKDENKENNNIDNLEWCDIKYNNSYGSKLDKKRKKVICITTGKEFNSIKKASEFYNIDNSTIVKVCKGKRKYGGMFKNIELEWKYV